MSFGDVMQPSVQGDSGGGNGLSQRGDINATSCQTGRERALVPRSHCPLVNAVIQAATGLTIC